MLLPHRLPRRLINAPALQYQDFRFLGVASMFNGFGMMGEMVVIGWVVLELTDSPFAVGATMGLRMVPMLLLGIPAGAIADMVDRRIFMRLLGLAGVVPTGIPGLLFILDVLTFWHVLIFTFASGAVQAFQQTTRQSFAYDIVGPGVAVNGLAFMMLALRMGGMTGSLAAGSLIEGVGVGFAYFALAISHLMSSVVLLFVRSRGQAAPVLAGTVLRSLGDYFRELRTNRALLTLVVLTGGVEILGFSHQVLMPSLARDVLHVGAGGLGVMNGIRSVGGILGILALSTMSEVPRKGLMFLGVIYSFGALIVLLSFSESFLLVLGFLIAINAAAALSDVLSQSMMQLSVSNELRGRAMGSWILAIGTAPFGHTQIGMLASLGGVAFALSMNGAGLIVLAALVTLLVPSLRRL